MIEHALHPSNLNHLPGLEVFITPKGHPQVNIYPAAARLTTNDKEQCDE